MFSSWILLIICSIPKIRIKTTTILFHHLYVVNPLRKKSNENSFKKYILVDAWYSYSQTQDTYYQCANVGSLILSVYFRIIYNLYLLHSSQNGIANLFSQNLKVCMYFANENFFGKVSFLLWPQAAAQQNAFFVLQITWLLLHTENTNKVKTKPKKMVNLCSTVKKYYGIGHSFNFIEKMHSHYILFLISSILYDICLEAHIAMTRM